MKNSLRVNSASFTILHPVTGIKVAVNSGMFLTDTLRRECETLKAYGRGMTGGLLFGTPLLFTMEMWWLGFTLPPERLLVALIANFLVLLILERYSGFRGDRSFPEQVQDAVVAQGLGLVVAVAMLGLLNLLRFDMGIEELAGKVIMEAIAVSIGISVAITMLGEQDSNQQKNQKQRKEHAGFWGMQAIAIAGAIFFGLNVAATEEPVMIGLQMRPWQTLIMVLLSILLVFAITYALDFRGESKIHEDAKWHKVFVRDSIVTSTVALFCAGALLWFLGRFNMETGLLPVVQMAAPLWFATSLGAAAARLII